VRSPQGGLVGLAMVLADIKSVGDGVIERMVTPNIRSIMQRVAVLLRPAQPRSAQGESPSKTFGTSIQFSKCTTAAKIGKLSGALAGFSAAELGGFAIKAALERAGLTPEQIDYVFMGQVLQAGTGQITARQAAVQAGIPMTVPATTVNKVCLSGLNTIYLADQMIQAGDAEVVVAGGMESMSKAPYLLKQAREGYRMGNGEITDSLINDGLWCAFDAVHMGGSTER